MIKCNKGIKGAAITGEMSDVTKPITVEVDVQNQTNKIKQINSKQDNRQTRLVGERIILSVHKNMIDQHTHNSTENQASINECEPFGQTPSTPARITRNNPDGTIGSTIPSMYATILVCIYIAFSYTEVVRFPVDYQWLDVHGFFIYLFFLGDIYLLYLCCYVLPIRKKSKEMNGVVKFVANDEVCDK